MKDKNIENIRIELEKFLKSFKKIKHTTIADLIEEIKKIDNVVDVTPDEFDEIYTINVANLFIIKLKTYRGLGKIKLGNYLHINSGEKRIIEYKKILT